MHQLLPQGSALVYPGVGATLAAGPALSRGEERPGLGQGDLHLGSQCSGSPDFSLPATSKCIPLQTPIPPGLSHLRLQPCLVITMPSPRLAELKAVAQHPGDSLEPFWDHVSPFISQHPPQEAFGAGCPYLTQEGATHREAEDARRPRQRPQEHPSNCSLTLPLALGP